MIRHIIWDWNGTLLDDVTACVDAINVLLRRRHLTEVTRGLYEAIFDFPVRNYYLRLGFDFTREDWDQVSREYHAAYAVTSATSALREGAREALEKLRRRRVMLSVLSACEVTLLRRMMDERGVLECFDHVYGLSDLFAHSKVDLGHALLNGTGAPRDEALMVGDTLHDFEVAQAIGVPCLLMAGGHQSAARLAACGGPLVRSLPEVGAWIERGGAPA